MITVQQLLNNNKVTRELREAINEGKTKYGFDTEKALAAVIYVLHQNSK